MSVNKQTEKSKKKGSHSHISGKTNVRISVNKQTQNFFEMGDYVQADQGPV